jgi:hypothetical protein
LPSSGFGALPGCALAVFTAAMPSTASPSAITLRRPSRSPSISTARPATIAGTVAVMIPALMALVYFSP